MEINSCKVRITTFPCHIKLAAFVPSGKTGPLANSRPNSYINWASKGLMNIDASFVYSPKSHTFNPCSKFIRVKKKMVCDRERVLLYSIFRP